MRLMQYFSANTFNNLSLKTQVIISVAFSAFATGASIVLAFFSGLDFTVTLLELSAVFTTYMCVTMCITQTRWNYPIGVVGTFLYSWVFWEQGFYALAAFNLYLVGSLIFGWFRWGKDTAQRPISFALNTSLLIYVGLGVAIYALLTLCNVMLGGAMSNLEIWTVVLSGVAQFLLDNRRLETWPVWILVNILSIKLYYGVDGMVLAMFQYVFLLFTACVGLSTWFNTYQNQRQIA